MSGICDDDEVISLCDFNNPVHITNKSAIMYRDDRLCFIGDGLFYFVRVNALGIINRID